MAKRIVFLILFHIIWTQSSGQSLALKFGTPFKRADLKVIWAAGSNTPPSSVWVYRLLPNHFSAETISNVVALCSFSEKERSGRDTNSLFFESKDHSRRLQFLFHSGKIEYETPSTYYQITPSEAVPTEAELKKLAPSLLARLGIQLANVEKNEKGEPNIAIFDSFLMRNVKGTTVTNTPLRGIRFRRAVEGALWVGAHTGGDGEVRFGDHGTVTGVAISWRNLQRYKQYPTASPETLIKWIRQGKAVQNMIAANLPPIDWKSVKDVFVTKAAICYYAGGPIEPSDWLIPFVALWAQVHSEDQGWEVEIDCPIYDPKKPIP